MSDKKNEDKSKDKPKTEDRSKKFIDDGYGMIIYKAKKKKSKDK